MRTLTLIAFASLLLVAHAGNTQSQSATASGDSPRTLVSGKIEWDHYLPIKGDIKPPQALSAPPPAYDTKSGAKGTVVLLMAISETGNVDGVKILRSLTPDLDRKAIEAVSSWRFSPATKKLVPVPVQANVEVNFRAK
jgi:TonB family protein